MHHKPHNVVNVDITFKVLLQRYQHIFVECISNKNIVVVFMKFLRDVVLLHKYKGQEQLKTCRMDYVSTLGTPCCMLQTHWRCDCCNNFLTANVGYYT